MSAIVSARELFQGESHQNGKGWERWLFGEHPVKASVRALAIVLIGSFLVKSAVLPLRVGGNSMMPTFQNREFLLADRLSYRLQAPQLGDVVAIKTKEDGVTILKRIIGGPGDEIAMQDGRLLRNGAWLDEPYAALEGGFTMTPVAVGANEYWVVGDNRSVSEFGKVHRQNILGKVW